MNNAMKGVVVIGLVVLIGIVFVARQRNRNAVPPADARPVEQTNGGAADAQPADNADAEKADALPLLIDLGADKCIPCKAMKPVLDELAANYKNRFQTEFIDVWKNPDAAKKYNINLIPTQIFFDASGKELFRHEGFFSKEDILGKWKEFGIKVEY